MANADATRDEAKLLCERCGYVIDGMATQGRCPECGTGVGASLPEARPGSAWQRRAGIGGWARVSGDVLRRPLRLFREVRPVADRRTWMLLGVNLAIGSIGPGVMWVWVSRWMSGPGLEVWYMRASVKSGAVGTLVPYDALAVPHPWWVALLCVPALMGGLFAMTWIETVGVRFFGRRRGWRVTWPIALAVCSHASIGWAIGGVLHAMVPLARRPMWNVLDMLPESIAFPAAIAYVTVAPVAAMVVGMLVFETLVYLGVRECRYANAAKSGPPTMR